MSKVFLGIEYGHYEAALAAISDDGDVWYCREEWLSRVKNDHRFPTLAFDYVLSKIGDRKISAVGHFQKPLRNWLGIGFEKNLSKGNYEVKLRQFNQSDLGVSKLLSDRVGKRVPLYFSQHHLSHVLQASLFLSKTVDKALHIVLDGYGDGTAGGVYVETRDDVKRIETVAPEASLGLVYSAITEWAGFAVNEDEFKVMALSAFGEPTFKNEILEKHLWIDDQGHLRVNVALFNFLDVSKSAYTEDFTKLFGKVDIHDRALAHRNQTLVNTISSWQSALETIVIEFIQHWSSTTRTIDQIILSGGVFHNSVLVGRIEREFGVDRVLCPPSPGDAGSALGAAYYAAVASGLPKRAIADLCKLSPYLGMEADDLGSYDLLFELMSVDSFEHAKDYLDAGGVLAVYSGRMEIGPRALCTRSLICNAEIEEAVQTLNVTVKNREQFRPVAVTVNKSRTRDLFGIDSLSRSTNWMGSVWPLAPAFQRSPFAHFDASTRPQITDPEEMNHLDPVIAALLRDGFILGNTSLNISGDPICSGAEDLYLNCRRMGVSQVLNNGRFFKVC